MRKVPIPFDQRLLDLLRGPVALLVWVAAVSTAMWLLLERPQPVTHVAWVPTLVREETAPAAGTIEVLTVHRGQYVQVGDLIGRLDDRPLRARLATEIARIEELRARVHSAELSAADDLARMGQGLELAQQNEVRRYAADLRRYQGDETALAVQLLEVAVDLSTITIEIERLGVRLERAKNLVDDGIGPLAEVQDLTFRVSQAQAELERKGDLRERLEEERLAAAQRLAAFESQAPPGLRALVPSDTIGGLRAAVLVQELVVAELDVAIEGLTLTASTEGIVQSITRGEGNTVRAADVIFTTLAPPTGEAILFIDAGVAHADNLGQRVELRRQGVPELVVESTITSLAPTIELLPERLWIAPDEPRYGRAARVPLDQSGRFLPGEILGARFLE
ncbi:MAG: biotin/lipoyl-binding protein [Planctomycetota bacterium]|nr:biotin/lipoyl-binding protein [Planctomycetota bacterium]